MSASATLGGTPGATVPLGSGSPINQYLDKRGAAGPLTPDGPWSTINQYLDDRDYRRGKLVAIVCLVLAGLLVASLLYLGFRWGEPILLAAGVAGAVGSAILFVASYSVPRSTKHPSERLSQFARDPDGFPSLAILQFYVWTGVIVFAFSWITLIRIFSGVPAFPSSGSIIPENLLAVMGVSAGSTLASAAVGTLRNDKDRGQDTAGWITLLEEQNDSKAWNPSLGRFQMFAWTVVSVVIFLAILWHQIVPFWNHGSVGSLTLPDLNPTLLVLMGISHTGYVGSKYISINSQNKVTPKGPSADAYPMS
jgi:hypothetical protein